MKCTSVNVSIKYFVGNIKEYIWKYFTPYIWYDLKHRSNIKSSWIWKVLRVPSCDTLLDMNVLSLISPVVSNTFIVEMADRIILVRIAISVEMTTKWLHDDVIKWKLFPRYWPFVWGIHRSAVNSRHNEQWRGASMFSLICAWTNCWSNNRDIGDLRAIALIMTPRRWIP